MTHAELCDIVKDHRDVWGHHFYMLYSKGKYVELLRHDSNDPLEPEHVEIELLGLGVVWLVENGGRFNVYGPMTPDDTFDVPTATKTWSESTSILAAVYAAIGEVKKARPS